MEEFLRAAIQEAERGLAEGGIPIGSVLVHNGQILGRGHNRRVQQSSVVLPGEVGALGKSGPQAGPILSGLPHFTSPPAQKALAPAISARRRVRVAVHDVLTCPLRATSTRMRSNMSMNSATRARMAWSERRPSRRRRSWPSFRSLTSPILADPY